MLDHARKRIDPAPHILSIPRHVDTFHRREAEHYRPRHRRTTPSSEAARSAGTPAVKTHLTPLRVKNVTRRRRRRPRRAGDCRTSSMKPGIPPSWRRQRPGFGGLGRIRCSGVHRTGGSTAPWWGPPLVRVKTGPQPAAPRRLYSTHPMPPANLHHLTGHNR
jgi:hypothetical protein